MSDIKSPKEETLDGLFNISTQCKVLGDLISNDKVSEDLLGKITPAISDMRMIVSDIYTDVTNSTSPEDDVSEEDVDALATLAAEFDASGDELLVKQAAVIDQLLANFGKYADKESDDDRARVIDEKYHTIKKQMAEGFRADKKDKAFEKAMPQKKFRPCQFTLSTRHCPDHPGQSLKRAGEGIYRCPLDEKEYDWHAGFKLLSGAVVPPGEVSGQTSFDSNHVENTTFGTRENRQNKDK